MVRRSVGRSGLLVSPVAFGAFKIGRNEKTKYAQSYPLPDDQQVERLLNGVLDMGINLVDTAPAYGASEERVGRAIADRRSEYLLSTKVGETFADGNSTHDFSRQAITSSVERSLQRLRTDVLDFVFIHSDGRDLFILEKTDTVPALADLRRRGIIRFIGLSGKTVEGARKALAWADVLMIEYHPEDRSHEQVIDEAAAAGVGVFVKKPLASGRLTPSQAIPFILAKAGVGTLVVGTLSLDHLRNNVAIAQQVS